MEETLMKLNMSFLIKDDELLEKYHEIWEKIKSSIKTEFDSKRVYNEKYLQAKIKSYNGKINTNFHHKKIPREGSQFICLSVILINSVFKTGKNYYPQVYLEECKYVVKEKKILKYIIGNIEISSDSDKMTINYYQKTKKSFKKKHVKGTKIFLKKKKT